MTLNGYFAHLRYETVWIDSHRYQDAECQYHMYQAQCNASSISNEKLHNSSETTTKAHEGKLVSSIITQIANAREKITNILPGDSSAVEANSIQILGRIQKLEDENKEMRKTMSEMAIKIKSLEEIMSGITLTKSDIKTKQALTQVTNQNGPAKNVVDDDEEDIDLFGSDEETEEDARIREERLKAYENKKSKKPALVAKSSVVFDVKPWDDETDMKQLETAVRDISSDGLKWGASKLVPLAYGIKKLQIIAIVEDEKVSIDWLQEAIQENEDLVQSVDIAAFNKL